MTPFGTPFILSGRLYNDRRPANYLK